MAHNLNRYLIYSFPHKRKDSSHNKVNVNWGCTTFLLLTNFRQIPTWKIWFQPIGRIFHEKNGPNSPDFEKKILPIARFLLLVPIGSQKYKKILIFSYFHISTCGQIWLNHFHLNYITKLEKETLLGHSRVWTPYYWWA